MINPPAATTATLQRNMRILAALFVVSTAVGLFTLGAQPVAVGLFPPPWDKLAHLVTFAAIGGASGLASGTRSWWRVACCVIGAVAIGSMDEVHQIFLPGRSASWGDLAADATGGLTGAALLTVWNNLMHRWKTPQDATGHPDPRRH